MAKIETNRQAAIGAFTAHVYILPGTSRSDSDNQIDENNAAQTTNKQSPASVRGPAASGAARHDLSLVFNQRGVCSGRVHCTRCRPTAFARLYPEVAGAASLAEHE